MKRTNSQRINYPQGSVIAGTMRTEEGTMKTLRVYLNKGMASIDIPYGSSLGRCVNNLATHAVQFPAGTLWEPQTTVSGMGKNREVLVKLVPIKNDEFLPFSPKWMVSSQWMCWWTSIYVDGRQLTGEEYLAYLALARVVADRAEAPNA